ncbi:MAG: glycoside hydrolase family 43 protein [Turicibacter sp.]
MRRNRWITSCVGVVLIGGSLMALMGCENLIGLTGKSLEYIQINAENFDTEKYYMNTKNQLVAADPYVIDGEDGYYYAYATSDKLSGYGFLSWRSPNLVDWEEVGVAYYMAKDTWGVKDFWAPEVTKYNGKYYMHYTAKEADGKIKIGMAVSDTPAGPFLDLSNEPFFDPGYNVIDSNILIDDDGKMYMYYSRDCSEYVVDGRHESHIYGVELKDMKEVISEPVKLISPELPWEIVSGDYRWNEGPEIIKHNGKYYLVYSANFYNSREYALGYAVSDSPMGPFVKGENNQLLYVENDWNHVSGPGHNSFALSPDNKELYAIYHSHINPNGEGGVRQINLDKVGFREDGSMYINGPSVSPQPLPSGTSSVINLNSYIDSIEVVGTNTSDTNLLIDGEVVYHESNQAYIFNGTGVTELIINFNQSVKLSDLMIYGKCDASKIQLNADYYLTDIDFKAPQLPGEALILSFEAVETDSVHIFIDNTEDFSLSELKFLGVSTN